MEVSARGYRAYKSRPISQRQRNDMVLLAHIREQFSKSLCSYGRPRMTEELKELGFKVGHRRVGRLMRENGISAIRTRKHKVTTDSNHKFNIAPNLLGRDFTAESPNQKWVVDISYVWTREGWLYLAVVLGFLMSLMYGALPYVNRISANSYYIADQVDDTLVTQEFLRNLLENIYPERNSFTGSLDHMTFLSLISKGGQYKKLYKVSLYFTPNFKQKEPSYNLMMEWQSLPSSLDKKDQGSVILVDNISRVTFMYLDISRAGMQSIWQKSWSEKLTFPVKIKISLSKESKRVTLWPELIISLKINREVG